MQKMQKFFTIKMLYAVIINYDYVEGNSCEIFVECISFLTLTMNFKFDHI